MIRTWLIIILIITNTIAVSMVLGYRSMIYGQPTYDLGSKIIDPDAMAIEQELIDTRYALNLLKEGIRIGEKNKGCTQ